MNLVQKIPDGPLDIVGDIHGEYSSLKNLLRILGYDEHGKHANNRKLVFIGDYCDRGPNSPAVIELIERLVRAEKAVAILGNHEINLLRGEPKAGSGWFFSERFESDKTQYKNFERVREEKKENTISFLKSLPIALERNDLRIIHAAWIGESIEEIRHLPIEQLLNWYEKFERISDCLAEPLRLAMQNELDSWPHSLEDIDSEPPLLVAHADHSTIKQMKNPIKVLTAGVERRGTKPFFSNGRWRFAERVRWWDNYDEKIPVIVGHYWRKLTKTPVSKKQKNDPDMFETNSGTAWHGKHNNVFCVDYSIGGRSAIKKTTEIKDEHLKLAVLQWPENILVFDDGTSIATQGFLKSIF